jgi:hypothetical protein
MITVAASAARPEVGPVDVDCGDAGRLQEQAQDAVATRVQWKVGPARAPAELATQAEEAHARARMSITHREGGMSWDVGWCAARTRHPNRCLKRAFQAVA